MSNNKIKILFINPSVTRSHDMTKEKMRLGLFYHLGLGYIISNIESRSSNYEIIFYDALLDEVDENGVVVGDKIRYGATDERIRDKIESVSPDIVGVSCLFPSSEIDAINIIKITKDLNGSIKTIMGGVHPSNNAPYFMKAYPEIDHIVLGEGEITLLSLLDIIREEKYEELEALAGITYRNDDKDYINERGHEYIKNLDEIFFPDRSRFNMQRYLQDAAPHSIYKEKPFTQILTSRGCPLKCTYCALSNHWGRLCRFRSAKNVVDEMEYLVKEYGVKEIHFEDDNFTANKKRVLEIFKLMKERNINVHLNCPTGTSVQHLDEELIEAMKEAGFYSISLGIESGDEFVVKKLMKKHISFEKIPRLVKKMREVVIEARGFFMLGYPEETKETIMKTVNYAKSLQLDWTYFFVFTPYPNTPIYQTCIDKGYIDDGEYDVNTYNLRSSILRGQDFEKAWLEDVRENAIIDCNFKYNPNRLRKNYAKAIKDISSVVELYPNFDFANFYLAECYNESGDKAKMYYENTIRINPNHEEAKKRLYELDKF